MMLSRYLNSILGTTHITPWTLGEIPEIWIDILVKMGNLEADMKSKGLI